jgi:hypothetical protein
MNHLPGYLWALTYAEVTGIAAATAYALYRGARAAGLGNRVSTRMGSGAALLFGGWLAVTSLVAGGGSYRERRRPAESRTARRSSGSPSIGTADR